MQWHILDTDGQAQPLTEPQIAALIKTGQINRQTMVWADGMADWQEAGVAWPDLFPVAAAPRPPAMPQPPAMPPMPRPGPRAPARPAPKSSGGFLKKLVLGVVVLAALGIGALMIGSPKRPPGYDGLKQLELSLSGATTRGSGATAAEQKAATVLAETAESMRDLGISKGSGRTGRGLSGLARKAASGMDANGFTAVCSIKGDTAIFLLHVPDLRKFTNEAKDSMATMAWFSACLAWQGLPEPRPSRVCVGVKGIISYDRVLEGKGTAISLEEDLTEETFGKGIQITTKGVTECQDKLSRFFAEPATAGPVK